MISASRSNPVCATLARCEGLTFRSLADTAQATLAFHESRPAERKAKLRAGISPEREAEVLAAWKKEKK